MRAKLQIKYSLIKGEYFYLYARRLVWLVVMNISVTIKPHSKKAPFVQLQPDGTLIVCVREIAADGQANTALIKLLSDYYKVAKTRITIVRGHTSRHKLISIADI